ncbi:hypothetical protein BuS5_02777 [Desulfosarcina sp. BuS5]|uniref:transposase n=1 Tax=Desulfosarcina sp. BuS5 TaxID=933262 RepID=UPI0004837EF1|nr:hypothetical protein BuS5_02777 [Desulfosarcina sp. BuS5]
MEFGGHHTYLLLTINCHYPLKGYGKNSNNSGTGDATLYHFFPISTILPKFVGTLKNWWDEILNYFIERVSNGYVEGQNNAIRNIIRRAFGYRNFNNFRLQVFAELGSHTNPR